MEPKEIIEKLQLLPHPEGGFYKETYRSAADISIDGNVRQMCTSIYFMLEDDNKSHFHRIKSDELWFFHLGEPLEIVTLNNGMVETILLGSAIEKGELLQAVIPAGIWFGSRIKSQKGFVLVSCTVAPGFDFADFELAKREDLLREYPHCEELVKELTYD
jgi:predicted cupin superfamily sugar epimerase